MLPRSAPFLLPIIAAGIILSFAGVARTQPPADADMKVQLQQQAKEIQDLKEALGKLLAAQPAAPLPNPPATMVPGILTSAPQPPPAGDDLNKLVNDILDKRTADKKAADKATSDEGYKVGTDMSMKASWVNGVVFETPNKDFWMRTGFRFQYEDVRFKQSTANRKEIGEDMDGNFYRRIRPNFSGGFWEVGEFNAEVKLENIANGTVGMDDVWVGVKDIPFIGTVRTGHFHLPHGLEADMYSSSKPTTFFEVYSGNNALYQGERCGSGLWLTNSYLNDRVTYAVALYHPDQTDNGTDFAQADYAYVARATALPIYEDDGRCLMHIGGSYTWRHQRSNPNPTDAPGTITFSTDAEIRDRTGGDNGFGNDIAAPNGAFQANPGNKTAWVSTGAITANSESVYALEFLYIHGPFSIQAEYDLAYINDGIDPKNSHYKHNYGFTGGYIQLSYFLTRENRTYDKRFGKLGSEYIARANTPFWLVRDENGSFNHGLGAWELTARASHLDLNDMDVQGGILDQYEAGVNWHLNNNLRVQFLYLHAERYDLSGNNPSSGMNAFGVQTQFTF